MATRSPLALKHVCTFRPDDLILQVLRNQLHSILLRAHEGVVHSQLANTPQRRGVELLIASLVEGKNRRLELHETTLFKTAGRNAQVSTGLGTFTDTAHAMWSCQNLMVKRIWILRA